MKRYMKKLNIFQVDPILANVNYPIGFLLYYWVG